MMRIRLVGAEAAEETLKRIGKKIDPLIRGAVNTTATQVRKQRFNAPLRVAFPSGFINKGIVIKRANSKRRDARLIPSSSGVNVTQYKKWTYKCVIAQGYATVVGAHRGTTVAWDVPTAWAVRVDLIHTLKVNAQRVLADGRCRQVVDKFNLDSGSALTTLSIAVMLGGGDVTDPLTPPPFDTSSADRPTGGGFLGTQLGGLSTSPPYDDTRYGFSGNYTTFDNDVGQEPYPRRFAVPVPEIPAAIRDEWKVEIPRTYRVAIPNNTLELS